MSSRAQPFRGSRTPAGGLPAGGATTRIRDAVPPLWPGIPVTGPDDWCGLCTRGTLNGVPQIKALDRNCRMHRRTRD